MNCSENKLHSSSDIRECAQLKPFNWNIGFPELENPYKEIHLTWVNSAKTKELLSNPKELLDKSGLNIILGLINRALGDKLEGYYVDFGTIAGKTSFTNVVNDLLLLYGKTWDNLSDFVSAYKTVFSCLIDEERMTYLHGSFFRAPEKAQFIYSKCVGNSNDADIASKILKFSDDTYQAKKLKELDENYFTAWHCSNNGDGFVGVIPLDVPDLSVEPESKDIQTLLDNHFLCHKLFHATLPDGRHTIFVSIPIVGTSSVPDKSGHLSGQGAVFLLLMPKDCDDISEKELIDLSSNISSFCKDMFLPYLHDASMGMVNEALRNGAKAAVAAVMSRNGSHNLGSHVIYNVIKDIDCLNVQDNRLFFKYLQQRMDFLAQVSTDWVPEWSSSSWLVHEVIRGFLEQAHLLSYIGKSEGLQVNPHGKGGATLSRRIRPITNVIYKIEYGADPRSKKIVIEVDFRQAEEPPQSQDNELTNDILVAVPGGLIGYHALYTIFENFIRNAAKHEFATLPEEFKEKTHLQISFEIEEDQNRPCYKCRIWDNLSYISHIPQDSSINKVEEFDDLKVNDSFNPDLPQDGKLKALRIIANGDSYMVGSEAIIEQNLFSKCKESQDMWAIVHPFDKSNGHWQERTLAELRNLIRLPNVRLVPESKFIRFANGLHSIAKNMWPDRLKDFLADVWLPLHMDMNTKLREPLIKYDGTLKKGNWGLSEIKICAGYLANAKNIWNVAKALDPEEPFINTAPVEDVGNTQDQAYGNARAYRLGFSFQLNKPKEVLIVGLQLDQDKVKELGRYGIFMTSDLFDDGDYDFEFVVLTAGAVQTLVNKIKGNPAFLEKMPFRIIAVTTLLIYRTIPEDFGKRVAHCDEAELKFLEQPVRDFTSTLIESFKIKTYEVWVKHLKNTVRNIQDELYLVAQPAGGDTPDPDHSIFDPFFNDAAAQHGASLNSGLKRSLVKALRSTYGFYDKSHRPATLPIGLSSKRDVASKCETKVELIKASFASGLKDLDRANGKNIYELMDFFDHELGDHYYKQSISYLRHSTLSSQLEKAKLEDDASENIKQITCTDPPVYQEPLGGGAAHFPMLSSLCNLRASSPYYYNKLILRLIENGLFTVAVADERLWDYVAADNKKGKILEGCGVYPVAEVIDYVANNEYSREGMISVLRIRESNNINSLKITGIEPLPCGLVIHQGILDKINWENTSCGNVEEFIKALRKRIPFVAITSGRGKPYNLPAKFLGFSHIENFLLSDPHSKLLFSDVFMRLILAKPGEEQHEE